MNTSYALTLGFLLSCIIIFSLVKVIEIYLKSRANRFNPEKNYIVYIAIGALLLAFTSFYPTPSIYIINSISKVLFNTEIEGLASDPKWIDIVVFLIFVAAICLLVFIAKKVPITPLDLRKFLSSESPPKHQKKSTEKQINYPDPIPSDSPHLYLRVKELFELQYKKQKLQLKSKIESNDPNGEILYGYIEDRFDIKIKLIYCDKIAIPNISINRQNEVYNLLKKIDSNKIISDRSKSVNIHYYYITLKGNVVPNKSSKSFQVCTEDEFLNSLIDFKPYLQDTLINEYENDKLFSAINKEEDRKTLKETFIAPNWALENQDQATQTKLVNYIDNWITQSIPKHLVLLGDYGMGKTSFFKHYAAHLAQEVLSEKTIHRFPVLISLTNTSPMHGGLNKLIEAFVAKHLGVNYALFEKLVQKGKILFLLDSFDEMGYIGTHEQQFEQFNQIWQLATTNNKILISGRPSYFPSQVQLKQSLNIPKPGSEAIQTKPYTEVITLENLTLTDISKYLSIYYPNDAKKYNEWLVQNKSLLNLCRRPSMMHIIREMMPTLYQEKNDFSANKVMSLYIDYWIDRQETKAIRSAFLQHENQKQPFLKEFYTELAASFYLKDQLKDKHEIIIKTLHSFLDDHPQYAFLKNQKNIQGLEREILSAYFLEIDPDDEYKFVHKSFFEFFVAAKIIELVQANDFKHPLIGANWSSEIIDFTYDVIEQKKKEKKVTFKQPIPALLIATGGNRFMIRLKTTLFWFSNLCFHKGEEDMINFSFIFITISFIYGLIWFKLSIISFWGLIYLINILLFTLIAITQFQDKEFGDFSLVIFVDGILIVNFINLLSPMFDVDAFFPTILKWGFYTFILLLAIAATIGFSLGTQQTIGKLLSKMHFFQFTAKAYYIYLIKERSSKETHQQLFNTLHQVYDYKYFKNILIKSIDHSCSNQTLEEVSVEEVNGTISNVTFQDSNLNRVILSTSFYNCSFIKTKFHIIEGTLYLEGSSFDPQSQANLIAQIRANELRLGKDITLDIDTMLPLIRAILGTSAEGLNDIEVGKVYLKKTRNKILLAAYFYEHKMHKDQAREYIRNVSKEKQEEYITDILKIIYWHNELDKANELILIIGLETLSERIDFDLLFLLVAKKQFNLIHQLAKHNKSAAYLKNEILPFYEKGVAVSDSKKVTEMIKQIQQVEIDYA